MDSSYVSRPALVGSSAPGSLSDPHRCACLGPFPPPFFAQGNNTSGKYLRPTVPHAAHNSVEGTATLPRVVSSLGLLTPRSLSRGALGPFGDPYRCSYFWTPSRCMVYTWSVGVFVWGREATPTPTGFFLTELPGGRLPPSSRSKLE